MHPTIAKLAFFLAAAAVCCGFFIVAHARPEVQTAHASCWPRERDALLALKEGISDSDDVDSWQERHQDCCSWKGVTCSNQTGHVTKLRIVQMTLAGQLSPFLLSLEHLEYLNLRGTSLFERDGRVFPEFLCSLHNLRLLDLSLTKYYGTLLPQLANLSKLEYLDLSGTLLSGTLPPQLANLSKLEYLDLSGTLLSGTLPPQLANLSKLEYLDLSGTNLSGTLPPQLAKLSKMEHLGLSNTHLSGTILPQLGNLSKLKHLDLSYTPMSGALPPQLGKLSNLRYLSLGYMQNIHTSDISWLANLHVLEYVDMSDINLSTAEVFSVANTVPSLKALFLINCSLPSANQTLTHLNLTKLEQLDLSSNYLGHPIETCWFWNITSITDLTLNSTYLHGPFPEALGGMTSLQNLEFRNNGNSATLMADLKNLCHLESLWLDGSLALGNITDFVGKMPRCSSSKLSFLSSSDNNMTGTLPDLVGHLNSLHYLILINNSITGAIPSGLRNLTSLSTLNLSLNKLTGQIPMLPTSLTELAISMNYLSGRLPLDFGGSNLRKISLSSNYLTGHVPKPICDSENLDLLDLSNNFFEGEFPSSSAMPNMEHLLLSSNNFSGNFPAWLKNCTGLVFLDLAMNKFSGMLPEWIGELANLRFLELNHNMFYGDIPVNITNLAQLQHFSLASNHMSGSIPFSLSKLTAMQENPHRTGNYVWYVFGDLLSVVMKQQELRLSVVMKQQELRYGTLAINGMVGIDLSLNRLTGGIPGEIGTLNGLLYLNLSWNHLSGKIPVKIGDMKSLESLDFSRNNISGEIPASLSNLTYLSSLDLSYNNLAGRIPTGNQLDTLYNENPSMYNGNIGLCGPSLEKNCPANNAREHGNQQRSENGYDLVFFYFGLTDGFVVGLWVVLGALLFKKAWRNSYFQVFDKLYDNVYVFAVLAWRRITSNTART